MLTNTQKSPFAKVVPLEGNQVKVIDGFWKEVVENTAIATVPHLQSMFEDKDISHVLENFRICAGEAQGKHAGTVFGDGDFYKWMEAAIYCGTATRDEHLLAQIESYCQLIARAQLDDGYLSTKQIIREKSGEGVLRMGDVNDFEIYNMGHLFTTACLYLRSTKKDSLMKVAIKAADYLEKLYIDARKRGEVKTAVCPSHYMGLIELYRTTGEKRYLNLAQMAIELRDSVAHGTDDNQDRIPLKQHTKIIGHAVRANYLYAGVADLYAETGDDAYLEVLHRVWENLVTQKIYITGGCGALYNGVSPYGNFFDDQKTHQAYGYEYQLPNITAYNESCASVGLVLWAYRMFLIEPKSDYMDWIERAMFNVNLAAISLDGKHYFYENMLRRTKELPYELVWPLQRSEYILSYCCPPNIARTLSQISEYFYTVSKNTLWCGLYGANEAIIMTDTGMSFVLRQTTDYPYKGTITLQIDKISDENKQTKIIESNDISDIGVNEEGIKSSILNVIDGKMILNVRIPSWVESGYVLSNGLRQDINEQNDLGYISVEMEIVLGRMVSIEFDMPVRLTQGHPLVEETTRQVAVERGPLVYCIESADINVESMDTLMLDLESEFDLVPYEIGGRQVMSLVTQGSHAIEKEADREDLLYTTNRNKTSLYTTVAIEKIEKSTIRLVPYFAWDNRGFGEMKIWMPVTRWM